MDHAEKVKGQFKASYKDKNVHKKSSQSKPWKKDSKERTYTKKEVQMLLKRTSERLKEKNDSDDEMDKELNQIGKFSADPGPLESSKPLKLATEIDCYSLSSSKMNKKPKLGQKSPEVIVEAAATNADDSRRILRCLIDSGSSESIILD